MAGFTEMLGGLGATIGAMDGRAEESRLEDEYDRLIRQSLDQYGRIDPELLREIVAEQMGPSAAEGIEVDPMARQAQSSALARLQQIATEGGMTVEDRAKLAAIESEVSGADQARRNSILASQRRRGGGGGGNELAALLGGTGDAANAHAQGAYDVHAESARRALQALQGQAQLGTQMRNQSFGEQESIARSRDGVAEFNARLRQQAQEANQRRDQQVFQNKMQRENARADARTEQGKLKLLKGQRAKSTATGVGRGIGTTGGGMIDMGMGAGGMMGGGGGGGLSAPPMVDADMDDWNNPFGGY